MPEVVYLNGQFVPPEEAVVSINDRGFLFGDAVYEVVRSYGGRLWALEPHLRRLQRSLREVDLHGVDIEQLGRVVEEACRRSGFPEASVYIQVTRGVAPRRHAYSRDMCPTVLVHVRDMGPMVDPRMAEGVGAITAPDLRWRRCDIKSTNLLANVLARTRATEQGAFEAILVDEEGYVTEATAASVFCVEDGVVFTRPAGPEILPSITRGVVIELAQEQEIPIREERVAVARFRKAQEVFLAGTGDEVCPVVQLDGAVIGDGRPGPITKRLLEAFRAKVAVGI
jgi:D-alanine transaminase